MDETIHYAHHGAVAVITYDRPARRNAWNVECVRAVIAAIGMANDDPAIGAIILTGRGDAFCAGVDLKSPSALDPVTGRRLTLATFTMGEGERNWITLLARSKPVIAAVNGAAVGIGATHILAADMRIAARSATFSFPFLKRGMMPECGSSALLPRIVGSGRAMDLFLRGDTLSAQEALDIGLVTALHDDLDLLPAALALGQQIAALPSLQVRLTKSTMSSNAGIDDADKIMQTESDAFLNMFRAQRAAAVPTSGDNG